MIEFRRFDFTHFRSEFYGYVCGCFVDDIARIVILEGEKISYDINEDNS